VIPAIRLEKLRDGQVSIYPPMRQAGRCSKCAHITPPAELHRGEVVSWHADDAPVPTYTPTRLPASFRRQ
jgi:hypothetical protein